MDWQQTSYIASRTLDEETGKITGPVDDERLRLATVRTFSALSLATSFLYAANSQLATIRWTLIIIAVILAYIAYRL